MVRFLFEEDLTVDPAAAEKALSGENASRVLAAASDTLTSLDPWETGYIEDALRLIPDALQIKPKAMFQVLRVAITGSMVSLPLFESITLIGRDKTLARLGAAQAMTKA